MKDSPLDAHAIESRQMPDQPNDCDLKAGFEIPKAPTRSTPEDHETLPSFDSPPGDVSINVILLGVGVGPVIAILGGILSAPAAMVLNYLEMAERGWWGLSLGAIVVAPWVEELVKPLGVYFLAWKWDRVFTSRLYNASLGALAGLMFGTIENLLYVHVAYPDMPPEMVDFRWRYCTALHVVCATIFSSGVTPQTLRESLGGGNVPRLSLYVPAVVAIAIHTLWNLAAMVSGVVSAF